MSSWIGCYAVYTSEDDVATTKSTHSLASQLKAFRVSHLRDPAKTEFVYLHRPRCNVSLITGVQRNAGTISLATVSHPFISDLRSVMARSERIVIDMAGDTDKCPIVCQYDPRIPVWLAEAFSENTNCESAFPTDRVVRLPFEAPLITTSVQCDTTIPIAGVICVLRFCNISGQGEDSVRNRERGSRLFVESPRRVFPLGSNTCKNERLRGSADSETLASILGKFLGFPNEENWDALTSYRPVNFGIDNILDDAMEIPTSLHQPLLPFSPKHRDLAVVIESYAEHANGSSVVPTRAPNLISKLIEHMIKICAQIVISNSRGELSWRRVDQSRPKLHPSRLACRRVILLINGSIVISESNVGECDAENCGDISVSTRDVVITDGSVDRLDLSPAAAVIRVTHRTRPPASSTPDISANMHREMVNETSHTSAHGTRTDALVKAHGTYPFDLILKYTSSAEVLLAVPETALLVSASTFAKVRGPKASFVGIWPSLRELAADIVPTRTYSGAFAPIVIPMPISKMSDTTEQCGNITPEVGESIRAEIVESMTGISRELDALIKLADTKTNPPIDESRPSTCTPLAGERSKQRNREELPSLELNMSKVWAVSQLIRPLLDATDSVRTLNSRIHLASKTSVADFFNFSSQQKSLPRILLLVPSGTLSRWCDALGPLLHSVFQREWNKWLVHGGLLASECLDSRQTLNALLSEWADGIVSCAPFTTTPFIVNGRGPSVCYFRPHPVVFLTSEDYRAGDDFSFLYSGTWRPSIMAYMHSTRNSLLPRTMLHANIGLAPMHFKRHFVDETDEMDDCSLRRTLWEHYVAILQTGSDKPFGGYPVPFCNSIRAMVECLMVCCHGIRRAKCKSSGRVVENEVASGHCVQRHQHSEPQAPAQKVTLVGSSLRLANMSCLEWE